MIKVLLLLRQYCENDDTFHLPRLAKFMYSLHFDFVVSAVAIMSLITFKPFN